MRRKETCLRQRLRFRLKNKIMTEFGKGAGVGRFPDSGTLFAKVFSLVNMHAIGYNRNIII